MPSLLTLRPAPRLWELDLCPHAYDAEARELIKCIPGMRWEPDASAPNGRGVWRGAHEASRLAVRALERAGLVKVRTDERRDAVPDLHFDAFAALPPGLFTYQVEGTAWLRCRLAESGGALLADEMGLGKSAQAIAACDALDLGPDRLVVCPAIVVPHWREQVKRWGSSFPEWHIRSYEKFTREFKRGELPDGIGFTIFDEAHYLSNSKSLRSKAASAWCARNPSARRILLTGTPMQARPKDLWHLLEIAHPGRFGSFFAFTKRYCAGRYEPIPNTTLAPWVCDGVSHADELAERLRAVMLRRTKAEVGAFLPPLRREIIECEIPRAVRRDAQRAAAAIDWRGNGRIAASQLLSQIETYKIDAAVELAGEIRSGGGNALILTTRKDTAVQIASALGCPAVDGDTPVARRRAEIVEAPLACATIFSITTGIDLTNFDHVIMVGLDWLPSTMLQGEARTHRPGQTRPVLVTYLIGTGTLDEIVRERVIDRLSTWETLGGAGSDGLAVDLAGGTEEELLAAMAAACGKAT